MISILAAAAVSITINLGPKPKSPKVTCHHGAVSYLFLGKPGVTFNYEGRTYIVPATGSIELVNDGGKNNYVTAGKSVNIEAGQLDAFGTQTIKLAESQPEGNVNVSAPK
jgi:hypothetical protein